MVAGTIRSAIPGLFLAATALAQQLQFAPAVGEYEGEAGIKSKHLIFSDSDGKKVTYLPPNGWDYSGTTSKLTLRPPNKPDAEATVTRVKLPDPLVLDDAQVKALAQKTLDSVPNQSTDVALVSQEKNTVFINGKETLLVTVRYTLGGRKFGRSVLFLNRDKEQLRFQLTSLLSDFEQLQGAFFRSQFTWNNL